LRIKEQETRLTLQEHDDDDDITLDITNSYSSLLKIVKTLYCNITVVVSKKCEQLLLQMRVRYIFFLILRAFATRS